MTEAEGYRVLRFWNNEALKNPEGMRTAIAENLRRGHPHPNPPPSRGRAGCCQGAGATRLTTKRTDTIRRNTPNAISSRRAGMACASRAPRGAVQLEIG